MPAAAEAKTTVEELEAVDGAWLET